MTDLLIVGHRKSGTTLVSNLLQGHSHLNVYPEDLCLFYGYYPHHIHSLDANALESRINSVVFSMLARKAQKRGYDHLIDIAAFKERFWACCDRARLRDIIHVYGCLRSTFAQTVGAQEQMFTCKETSLEIFLPTLEQTFQGAKIVHVVRDPRDNFAAIKAGSETYYKKLGEQIDTSLDSLLTRVAYGLEQVPVNMALFGSQNYHIIRFEDLAHDPHAVLESLCDFAEIPFERSLLEPSIYGVVQGGNSHDGVQFSGVSAQNVGRWTTRITDFEAQVIEFHLGDVMGQYGYQAIFSQAQCGAAAAEWYARKNYKYYFHDPFEHADREAT
jgi:hypothetical protein